MRRSPTRIAARGVDLEEAAYEGRYVAIDAADLLSTFMVDGAPDRERFQAIVTPLLDRAAARETREVRVYGEMVALLWDAGDVTSTIALEDMWNELAVIRAFSLLCGYPISAFDVQSRALFEHICGQHSGVRSPPGMKNRDSVESGPATRRGRCGPVLAGARVRVRAAHRRRWAAAPSCSRGGWRFAARRSAVDERGLARGRERRLEAAPRQQRGADDRADRVDPGRPPEGGGVAVHRRGRERRRIRLRHRRSPGCS